ncbi:MAG: Mrp/NBP35 family ATP-binding protein [Caulobacteraceae bacterium]|nr:Mrp/NBP35 family ATP-binding protein [Caulobacteraceae bacterium]
MTAPTAPDRAEILKRLEAIEDPASGRGLVSAGLVQGLAIAPGRVSFMLEVSADKAAAYAPIRDAAQAALQDVAGVEAAQVVLTAPAKRARVSDDPQASPGPSAVAARPPHVKRVIAVASGKGGVGKSTVAVNLACALAGLGQRVGLMDADVYGPSAPRMLGVSGQPQFSAEKKIIPLEAFGLKVMSIGFLVGEGAPMIWRGPMASSAARQMSQDVVWGSEAEPLDVLVLDLPPGTGDIHLTLLQRLKIDGVVLVSTPQEIALIDARRAASMFQKTGAPILGVIENMAWFAGPDGARIPIFGEGGGRREAQALGVPLLAEIPIDISLRESGDDGRPLTAVAPESDVARRFTEAAQRLSPSPLRGGVGVGV